VCLEGLVLFVYSVQYGRKFLLAARLTGRDVKVWRPAFSRDSSFGLHLRFGLTVVSLGLGLGLIEQWSRSDTLWSRGLRSIVMTSDCVPCFVSTRIWSL